MSELILKIWTDSDRELVMQFLDSHIATSMFLLGNLQSIGPQPTDHPNSGQYWTLWSENELIGVYCITRSGSLLAQVAPSFRGVKLFNLIIDSALIDHPKIIRSLGHWDVAFPLWQILQERGAVTKPKLCSKENLYQLNQLAEFSSARNKNVRYLRETDFDSYLPSRVGFMQETGVDTSHDPADLKKLFLRKCDDRHLWGYFENNELVSISALNSRANNIGQVGGVYTAPHKRRQGYSKETMRAMMADCFQDHKIEKMLLFTGETNHAANQLYTSLGYQQMGFFALIIQ